MKYFLRYSDGPALMWDDKDENFIHQDDLRVGQVYKISKPLTDRYGFRVLKRDIVYNRKYVIVEVGNVINEPGHPRNFRTDMVKILKIAK